MQPMLCPDCDSPMTKLPELQRQEFQYGVGQDAPILFAMVPVWKCDSILCGTMLTDGDGEDARQAAVDAHLRNRVKRVLEARGPVACGKEYEWWDYDIVGTQFCPRPEGHEGHCQLTLRPPQGDNCWPCPQHIEGHSECPTCQPHIKIDQELRDRLAERGW